ncbi:Fanconi anemia group D2 protein homolog isoform X2 [Durio zibethinus]|uniref:Fanconi anemia group D2 protein homolog isoform X2 n=1 Tax=Durio zibethinus TaxID=66656 RepID=A0A6P6A249_DURZI|nr:Fanconi anemia group D2 protein homolog isoform X2 [Durio zibethinus]
MAFLHYQNPSRKRPSSSFVPPFPAPKIPKSQNDGVTVDDVEKMVSVLAEGGCTLVNPLGPPSLPVDPYKLRRHLSRLLSSSSDDRSLFLSGFSSYIQSPSNLRRVLISSNGSSLAPTRSESLVRHLLLVAPIQLDIQIMLLEKLPEYFDVVSGDSQASLSLEDDVARLIINQFRWLDFIVDPASFTDKLMQVLSICPLHLKKEIIGSLPEIIGDQNNKTLVDSLEQMLHEDPSIIVPVLDSFSNLNLDDELQEQVITIALSCIRTIDAEHMPCLLRFLLLSATQVNVRRIISQIREHLKFVRMSNTRTMQNNKLKGKLLVDNTEASILDALRSSLQFKSEILKELNGLEKPRDHKVIDIWLLLILYTNGESMRKSIEKVFKKKIIEGCIQEVMLDECICGNKELAQEYFLSFLSLSEYLLACKEQKARDFGIYMYTFLFEEFADTYSRQEVLGALVTHVGSGVSFEISSALEIMASLATKHAMELIPLSSHINGILDYLEGLTVENLYKVYEVFSHMAMLAHSSADCFGSSIANELLIIVRKQVIHPDLKYKKMGLIGILKIVSCVRDESNFTLSTPFQKSNAEEALELLQTCLESCKQSCLSLIFFYDELTAILECRTLHPVIMDWIGNHVGEFESIFLSDLDGGQLPSQTSYCGLEGELWMNLDGEISPICLNILPLASSSQSASLQFLPANFHLLSAVERLTNQGSLGGIDALLGCPLLLPSSKYFSEAEWQSLTGKQKQIICLSLYYALNWIRELLNAFCTQVAGRFEYTSQSTKEDIMLKLLKRLRNLVFLESLLNHSIRMCPVALPQLHLQMEHCGSTLINQPSHMGTIEKKNEPKMTHECTYPNKRKHKKISNTSTTGTDGKLCQPTLLDVLRKAGAVTSQEIPNEVSSKERTSVSVDHHSHVSNESVLIEVSPVSQAMESQKFRFRPLLLECFSILIFSKMQDHKSCCSDPLAELPLYLYLIHDLHCKLDYFAAPGKQCSTRSLISGAVARMTLDEFLSKIRPLFPSLKRNLDSAFCILKEGNGTCQGHWTIQSAAAGNPDITNLVPSKSSISTMVFKEVLNCFRKMLNLPEVLRNKSVLPDLLKAFQPYKPLDAGASDVQPCPSPGTIEYSYLGACSFVESILDAACSFSFILASEALFTLESVVTSVQKVINLEGDDKNIQSGFSQILPLLCGRLGSSAQKLLKHKWDNKKLENGWKNKGEIVQRILRNYLEYTESTSDLLDELACTILPQVSFTTIAEDEDYGFPTLCSSTFLSWYRVLFEVNLTVLDKLVKEVVCLEKCRPGFQPENVHTHLIKMQKNVNVVVALVTMCRTYDKVTLHAMAVKYGGKFIDSFLKVFDFLQVHFQMHNEVILLLVKELQKATRTIQTLCSEAKGLKQTAITGKIPATKRSLERFLFRVKALLHATSNGCTFWMGNLKHKDLRGQVVSSQAYVDDRNDSIDEDPEGAVDVDPLVIVATASENSDRE